MSCAPPGSAQRFRLLVVDGDAGMRQSWQRQCAASNEIELVGTAINGRTAMPKVGSYRPDVVAVDLVTSDVEGAVFVEDLRQRFPQVGVLLMVADRQHAAAARARREYAGCRVLMREDLGPDAPAVAGSLVAAILQCAAQRGGVDNPSPAQARERLTDAPPVEPAAGAGRSAIASARGGAAQVVGIGTSTGGPNALSLMLPMLPADFPLPILIVQHMPSGFTASLAQSLARSCKLRVREAAGGELLAGGEVLIAPGGRHLRVVRTDQGVVTRITEDPPENSCRPAVDYLFRSLREVYGAATIGMMMTGMGEDGFVGCRQLRAAGAFLIAQDGPSCTVYGMPRGPIESGIVDVVAPLSGLAASLCDAASARKSPCS